MEERALVEQIRSKYETESFTESAEQVDRLMESLSQDLYSEPAHYGLEFVQNAEDCESSELGFWLEPRRLIVENNGKSFAPEDVSTLCNVGHSRKRSKIGYKGLGFKSIANISEHIEVHSADWHFEFNKTFYPSQQHRWLMIPRWIDQPSMVSDRTTFVIHLEGTESDIAEQLRSLKVTST